MSSQAGKIKRNQIYKEPYRPSKEFEIYPEVGEPLKDFKRVIYQMYMCNVF